MSTSNQMKQQTMPEEKAVPLADLMETNSTLETDYEVVEAPKLKRKRKPKPDYGLQIPISVVIGIVCLLLGFVVATIIAVVPTTQITFTPTMQNAEPTATRKVAVPIQFNLSPNDPSHFLDRWMMLQQAAGEISANSFVRILSQDDSPEFFNVVDLEGHAAIVRVSDLANAPNAPAADVYPPLGPYSEALGKNQKLLVTTEWNGGTPPGTLVYVMGWRVEDGTWIYEVSPDRVKIYYVPDIHLAWAKT
jgi:hypothetical protein